MRWNTPEIGDERVRSGITIIPMKIGDETRWMERVKWREEYKTMYTLYEIGMIPQDMWVAKEWLN